MSCTNMYVCIGIPFCILTSARPAAQSSVDWRDQGHCNSRHIACLGTCSRWYCTRLIITSSDRGTMVRDIQAVKSQMLHLPEISMPTTKIRVVFFAEIAFGSVDVGEEEGISERKEEEEKRKR